MRKRPRNQNLEERIRRRTALDPLKKTIQPILNSITQVEIEEEDEDDEEEEEEQAYKHPSPPKKRSFFQPSSSSEHAHFDMGENHRQNQSSAAGRMSVRNAGVGEIVEVEGGHIVRSTGRKDRHSKVCTAKGPRDRRVRLSAHTAIKFYDVQDRLGYDRPSKAVDWLIKNAKPAIDELEQLPPWKPSATNANEVAQQVFDDGRMREIEANVVGKKAFEAAGYAIQANPSAENSGFLPPSLDSFFPIGSSSTSSSSSASIHLQSRQNQDLRLSLQSFQDPLLLQHQHHHSSPSGEQALFAGSAPMAFDVSAASVGWSQQEMSRFQRLIAWNAAEGSGGGGGGGGGYVFPASSQLPVPLMLQNPFFSQRGPLQSSNSPSVRAWADLPPVSAGEHQLHQPSVSSVPAVRFASGGFSGFHVPARIQGDEEQDGGGDKLSSVSSAPHH